MAGTVDETEWHAGPSRKERYTKGTSPDVEATPRALLSDVQLPTGRTWQKDTFDTFAVRSAPGMTIVEWSRMGMWRKNLYGFLLALSFRLPDVHVSAWMSDTVSGQTFCFVALQLGDSRRWNAEGSGNSRGKARQAAAADVIQAAGVFDWIVKHHNDTYCADYL